MAIGTARPQLRNQETAPVAVRVGPVARPGARRLLLVDEDESLAGLLEKVFRIQGIGVDLAASLERAEGLLRGARYDLLLLDWNFPGDTGLDFVRALRAQGCGVPVLVASGRAALADRVAALHLGADDHLGKPFAIPELVARAQALIRRGNTGGSARLNIGGITIDTAARTAQLRGVALDLTAREFAVLEALAMERGRVVPKKVLFERVFDTSAESALNAIELYVHRLRRKLQRGNVEIRTVRRFGYVIDVSTPIA